MLSMISTMDRSSWPLWLWWRLSCPTLLLANIVTAHSRFHSQTSIQVTFLSINIGTLRSLLNWNGLALCQLSSKHHREAMSEVINAFEEQEHKLRSGSTPAQADIIRKCWDKGSFWYFQALHSPKGRLRVFNEHIQRIFCEEHCTQRVFDRTISPYWTANTEYFIQSKMQLSSAHPNGANSPCRSRNS